LEILHKEILSIKKEIVHHHRETKTELKELRVTQQQITADIKDIKDQQKKVKAELYNEINQIKSKYKEELKNFNNDFSNKFKAVEKSQQFISNEYEKQKNINNNIINSNNALKKENEILKAQISESILDLKKESIQRNSYEQYGRRIMLEINGIPRTDIENCETIVENLSRALKVNQNVLHDIDVVHRLSSKPNSGIIIKFNNRKSRDFFFAAKKNLKNINLLDLGYNEAGKIFINESLTPYNKYLFKEVRQRCHSMNYKYFWTRNGLIFVRKDDNTMVKKIIHEDNIKDIF